MSKVTGSISQHPARVAFGWYALAIALGALLLMHPWCAAEGAEPISLLDAIFTTTSVTCVTGLMVRSAGNDFSFLGQLVILTLIQLGGIGIMTVTTYVTLQLGARQGLRERAVLAETLGTRAEQDLRWVLAQVLRLTFAFEAVGFLLLATRFQYDHPPLQAFWNALFHAVSAFCNAGVALRDDSLSRYRSDWLVNPTMMSLIIVGGIGFPVLVDLGRNMYGSWSDRWDRLLVHTKLMLVGTAILLTAGTAIVLLLEWDGILRDLPFANKLLMAAFHSTSCRTAGFNSFDIGSLTNASLFMSMLLMLVGGGPCSTAGGFKVSTWSLLVLRGWATLRGYRQVVFARRGIPQGLIDRATAAALLYASVAIVGLSSLLIAEKYSGLGVSERLFMDAAFEVVSALGTVGLSTGITPLLSPAGRIVIMLLMFIGRLGPITVVALLAHARRDQALRYAQQEPLIG